jgi:hypothetical protein
VHLRGATGEHMLGERKRRRRMCRGRRRRQLTHGGRYPPQGPLPSAWSSTRVASLREERDPGGRGRGGGDAAAAPMLGQEERGEGGGGEIRGRFGRRRHRRRCRRRRTELPRAKNGAAAGGGDELGSCDGGGDELGGNRRLPTIWILSEPKKKNITIKGGVDAGGKQRDRGAPVARVQ